MWCLQFIYLTNDYKENFGKDSSARLLSRVLRRHISFHLSLLRTKSVAPNPGLDTENGPWWLSSHACDVCAPWGWRIDPEPAEDEHPRIPWLGLSPRRSHPRPTNRSATTEDFCSVLMAPLHCSVLALNNWIDWRHSLNSQSYCGCNPVFVFLSPSLIKSPGAGLGKINQHFSIYSCFHEVLSVTSKMYFIVLLFSFAFSLYKTQNWGREHQPVSECKQLQGVRVQGGVVDLHLWMEFSAVYENNKDLGCLSPAVVTKLIKRRRPKAFTFPTLLSLIWS